MNTVTTPQECAYPGCDQPAAAPTSDRGAKPKYCADDSHNPLTAHRERRRRDADTTGQRAEEAGGQPVTIGLTRAAELVRTLERLTAQHAETLARAVTELRSVGDVESAEAEVYAARTSADQRVAAAEVRLAEEINRRREAEADRDQAHAEREQADDAAAQAISRMEELTCELAALRTATDAQLRQLRADTAAEVQRARDNAEREIGQARDEAARLVADATSELRRAGHETARAQRGEATAVQRADRAQAREAEEVARIRADAQREREKLHAATGARLAALEETRDALRVRAERAEADIDSQRAENR
jgi:colicin import membrane protein